MWRCVIGLRGPTKLPTAVKIAQGNRGHESNLDDDIKPQEGVPEMPSGLSDDARRVWMYTVPLLIQTPGLLTVLDGSVLSSYCEFTADRDQVRTAIGRAQLRALADWQVTKEEAEGVLHSGGSKSDLTKEQLNAIRYTSAEIKDLVYAQYQDRLVKLENRINSLRREIGLSPSGRSSIRLAGGPESNVRARIDSVEESFTTGRPRIVKLTDPVN